MNNQIDGDARPRKTACLRSFLVHDANTVEQSHGVPSQILPTVCAWYSLECDHLSSHLPLLVLHLNPMRCHAKKPRLCCVSQPPICSDQNFPWSHLPQVNVNFAVLMRWQVSYSYFSLQLLYMLDKLVVKIHLHVVSSWKVVRGCFRPHGNKRVLKRGIISECERL